MGLELPSTGYLSHNAAPVRRLRETSRRRFEDVLPGGDEPPSACYGAVVDRVRGSSRSMTATSPTQQEFRDYFKWNYGPTMAVYRAIADDPERVDALDRDLAELARRHDRGSGTTEWEYLPLTARKRT